MRRALEALVILVASAAWFLIFRVGYLLAAAWTIQRMADREGHTVSFGTVVAAGILVIGLVWIWGPRRVT